MIEDIDDLSPIIRTVNEYLPFIIGCMLILPLLVLAAFKFKSTSATAESSLTQKLLPGEKQNDSVIKPTVTVKDKTITAKTIHVQ
jgi:hypothetical protein